MRRSGAGVRLSESGQFLYDKQAFFDGAYTKVFNYSVGYLDPKTSDDPAWQFADEVGIGGTSGGTNDSTEAPGRSLLWSIEGPTGDESWAVPGIFTCPWSGTPEPYFPTETCVQAMVECGSLPLGSTCRFNFHDFTAGAYRTANPPRERIGFVCERTVTGLNWLAIISTNAAAITLASGVTPHARNLLSIRRISGPTRVEAHVEINTRRVLSAYGANVPSASYGAGMSWGLGTAVGAYMDVTNLRIYQRRI